MKGDDWMEKQTVTFAVAAEKGVVTKIGRLQIPTPQIKFCGGEVKWFEDELKEKNE